MRKVFLEDLPRKINAGKEVIDWIGSVGKNINFIFDDIEGEFTIVESKRRNKIGLMYKGMFYEKEGRELKNAKIDSIVGKKVVDFRYEVGENIKTDYLDMTVIERCRKIPGKIAGKYYKVKCNICGWDECIIDEQLIKRQKKCSCCARKVIVEGINDIPTTDPWMIKYFQGGYDEAKLYSFGSGSKINPICPDCHKVKEKAMPISKIHTHRSIGCSCSDKKSYPEKFVNEFLMQLSVDFTTEQKFNWSRNKRYDFYILSENIVIEVHGGQHYSHHGFKNSPLEHQKENDALKRNIAEINGFKYIEIDARYSNIDYIKKSLVNSELSKIFDISNIDWNRCGEKASSNLIKEASNLKKNNPELKTTEIARIMRKDYTTISDYLTMGAELGWCEYDTRDEARKVAAENGAKSTSIAIKVYKDGKFLEEFKSGHDLTRRSKDVLGVKLNGKYALSTRKSNTKYKGYELKFES